MRHLPAKIHRFLLTICDVTCQNQAFVTEISCQVMILISTNVTSFHMI